jgi:ArsR family metal-binding transcriptional regulator
VRVLRKIGDYDEAFEILNNLEEEICKKIESVDSRY